MRSLKEEMNVPLNIFDINCNTIEEAINGSYKDDRYKFYLNSELLDVNDRFRIFRFNNVNYIAKKTDLKNGFNEQNLAKKAYAILNNVKINNFVLKVVLPELKIINDESYILTEYKGVSLQECLYSSSQTNLLKLEDINEIVDKFMSMGVLYRGFLPRNTIVKNNNIYLLDWEDVIFSNVDDKLTINKLCETNFLLNWSYFYDIESLKDIIKKYEGSQNEEPSLLKYEEKFKKLTRLNISDYKLRLKIMNVVLFAEKKDTHQNNKFRIPPNDMAHLISDLFNIDIDVLFDIICYVIRTYDEITYNKLLIILSNLIVYLYKHNENIQHYTIKFILVMLEIAVNKCNKKLSINNFVDLINGSKNTNFNLLNKLENCVNFEEILREQINQLLLIFTNKDCKFEKVTDLSNYILNL